MHLDFSSPTTREIFAQSKLLCKLGQFKDRIGSVVVKLAASNGRNRPDVTACEIVVNIHPSGKIRLRAEHESLHVAIDLAASAVVAEIERGTLQRDQQSHAPAMTA